MYTQDAGIYKVYFNLTYQLLIILTEFSLFPKDFPWDHGVVCIYYVPHAYILHSSVYVCVCVYITYLYGNKQKNYNKCLEDGNSCARRQNRPRLFFLISTCSSAITAPELQLLRLKPISSLRRAP